MKTERLSHVRAALYGQPWCIQPEALDMLCEIVEGHLNLDSKALEEKIDAALSGKNGVGGQMPSRMAYGQYEIQNGVAILPIMGPIMPRSNVMTKMSGATSLENFNAQFADAQNNKDVCAILIHTDSPGGSVIGLNEAASRVFAARNQAKPVVSLADGVMASAAYCIGSQAMECYCTEGSITGSIGVVMAIEDNTRAKENAGIRSIVLKTGSSKAIGVGPVTDSQIEELKGRMQDYFQMFKDGVERARAGIDISAVSTGSTWLGQKAVDMGLCDGVSSLEEQLARLGK